MVVLSPHGSVNAQLQSNCSTWCRMQQAKQAEQLEALQKAIEAKEATWKRLEGGQGKFADIKARFDSELANLQAQKDELQRERGSLIRVRPTADTA